ncbi:Aspartyl aminopeptidase [Maridesulfovibrio ferrireducens]|uniref:M18 family aminopeptidase n=1 Tax=Maridesulfovibrio ferrireducens TaxID=246191 RepID=A0A1G9L896_9BACT|nr:aminopeptidase [Maridesulfovibrio ferrireducens]SDL57775.1 Aspartyl aminopeptidase [Maridesulfovibrio ferrireducens]
MNKMLEHKTKSCWELFQDEEHQLAMDDLSARYIDFLSRCKTERETIKYVEEVLLEAGFDDYIGSDNCFRSFKDKTIFIARKGKKTLSDGFRLVGAHADTPRLDLKQHPLYEDLGIGMAKTHYYGGIRKYQWLARPLSLHGVVVKINGEKVDVVIGEDPNDPVLTILDLLPHLASKQVEKKVSDAFEGEKLNIVMGHSLSFSKDDVEDSDEKTKPSVKRKILEILNEKYGIIEEDFFSSEMHIVPAGPARYVGLDKSMVGGYGQDDRSCVFLALEAFLSEPDPDHAQIVLFYDKEEVGSEGSTGAKSLFFEYCLEDLIEAWEPGMKMSRIMMAGKALSTDVHAAIDPDYQDVHEKLNSAYLGYGPCFCKFTGHRGKVGANDAHAEYVGWLRKILGESEVPWQMAELGKVDMGGGGTVAKFLALYGMDVIDFGPPVLSMHSPFELTSKVDLYATKLAFSTFLRS